MYPQIFNILLIPFYIKFITESRRCYNICFLKYFFGLFMALLDSSAEEVTGMGMRERESDMQQRDPGLESNPGLPQEASVHGTPALPTKLAR